MQLKLQTYEISLMNLSNEITRVCGLIEDDGLMEI